MWKSTLFLVQQHYWVVALMDLKNSSNSIFLSVFGCIGASQVGH